MGIHEHGADCEFDEEGNCDESYYQEYSVITCSGGITISNLSGVVDG